ncbi:MAG: PTS sugar transporter subunit IIA [bacterium]|nr:PTS sugar transporter subunit IIA [bacterium]
MKNETVILLLSHGGLAEEMVKTVKLIAGTVEDVHFINFKPCLSFDEFRKMLDEFMKKNGKRPVLVLVDLIGGSCYNACSDYIKEENVRLFAGFNLGFVLEAIFLRKAHALDKLAAELDKRREKLLVYVNPWIK